MLRCAPRALKKQPIWVAPSRNIALTSVNWDAPATTGSKAVLPGHEYYPGKEEYSPVIGQICMQFPIKDNVIFFNYPMFRELIKIVTRKMFILGGKLLCLRRGTGQHSDLNLLQKNPCLQQQPGTNNLNDICFYKQCFWVFFASNEFMIHINTRVNETYIIVSVNSFLAF